MVILKPRTSLPWKAARQKLAKAPAKLHYQIFAFPTSIHTSYLYYRGRERGREKEREGEREREREKKKQERVSSLSLLTWNFILLSHMMQSPVADEALLRADRSQLHTFPPILLPSADVRHTFGWQHIICTNVSTIISMPVDVMWRRVSRH